MHNINNLYIQTHAVSKSQFTVFPRSQIASLGQNAVFHCKYPTSESIGWRVNGVSLGRMRSSVGITACTILRQDGKVIDRLNIRVNQDYNGATIECVALFTDRPTVISEPANLTVQGIIIVLNRY